MKNNLRLLKFFCVQLCYQQRCFVHRFSLALFFSINFKSGKGLLHTVPVDIFAIIDLREKTNTYLATKGLQSSDVNHTNILFQPPIFCFDLFGRLLYR